MLVVSKGLHICKSHGSVLPIDELLVQMLFLKNIFFVLGAIKKIWQVRKTFVT